MVLSFWLYYQNPICIPFLPIRATCPVHFILLDLIILKDKTMDNVQNCDIYVNKPRHKPVYLEHHLFGFHFVASCDKLAHYP
jgi:hypothetical protein